MTMKTTLISVGVSVTISLIALFGGMKITDATQEIHIKTLKADLDKYRKLADDIPLMSRELDSLRNLSNINKVSVEKLSIEIQDLKVSDATNAVSVDTLSKSVEKLSTNVEKLAIIVAKLEEKIE